jgi:Mg2+/citrate symporter
MTGWLKPAVIAGVLVVLVVANVIEFRAKRRAGAALTNLLEQASPSERLAVLQYRQTQNIEQLLHIILTTLFAILAALLWV